METVKFEDFFKIPTKIYAIIGRDPLKMGRRTGMKKVLFKTYCYVMLCYYLYVFFSQFGSIFSWWQINIITSFAVACCEGFCISGMLKEFFFVMGNKTILTVISELKEMFPTDPKLQQEYKVKERFEETRLMCKTLVIVCKCFTLSWAFYPIMRSTFVMIVFGGSFEKLLPFWLIYSYDPYLNTFTWLITFLGELNGAWMAGCFFLAVDLHLLVIIQQCCMHMDYISSQVENYIPTGNDDVDCPFVNPLIALHIKVLRFSDACSEAFELCILVNVFISQILVCLICFMILFGGVEDSIKGVDFLLICLLQIWIICFLGQMLIDSSLHVAEAVYNQEWFTGTTRYRRSLLIILTRAQKPATLHPPTMKPCSKLLFNDVMGQTYTFFCVLKTMFTDQF